MMNFLHRQRVPANVERLSVRTTSSMFWGMLFFNLRKFSVNLTFSFSDGPTKTDVDVLNALTDIEIDRATFPYVFNWKAAMLEHPIEERKKYVCLKLSNNFI